MVYALAVLGSLATVLNGQGGESLGQWNKYGPMSKGQIFYWFAIFILVIACAPLIDKVVGWLRVREESRIKKRFMKEFEEGRAKRHPPNDSN